MKVLRWVGLLSLIMVRAVKETVTIHNDEELYRAVGNVDVTHIRLCGNITMSLERWSWPITVDRELVIGSGCSDPVFWEVPFIPYSAISCASSRCQLTLVGPLTMIQNLTEVTGSDSIGFNPIFVSYPIGAEGQVQLRDYTVVIDRPDALFNYQSNQYWPENIWWTDDVHVTCLNKTAMHLSDWHVTSEQWTRIWYRDPGRAVPQSSGFLHMHNLTVVLDTLMDPSLLRPDLYCRLLEERNRRWLLRNSRGHQDPLWWLSLLLVLPAGLLVLLGCRMYQRRQPGGLPPEIPATHAETQGTRAPQETFKDAVRSDGPDRTPSSGLLVLLSPQSTNKLSPKTPWHRGMSPSASTLATEGARGPPTQHNTDSLQAMCTSSSETDAVQKVEVQHACTSIGGGQELVMLGHSGTASYCYGHVGPGRQDRGGGEITSNEDFSVLPVPVPVPVSPPPPGPAGAPGMHPNLQSPLLPTSPYPIFRMPTAFRDQQVLHAIQNNPLGCQVVSYLGAGGNGVVYQAVWRGSTVAMKVMLHRVDAGGAGKTRALAEAILGCRLRHPHLVATLEYAVVDPLEVFGLCSIGSKDMPSLGEVEEVMTETYIVMEFCNRGTLRSLIRSPSWAPCGAGYPLAVDLLLGVARAMRYLHAHQVIHGDLKASNVLLSTDPDAPGGLGVKVGDFGISRILQEVDSSHTTVSRPVGTLTHMAPEILQGQALSVASDVYAFGVVLYEVMTGHVAFQGVPCASLVFIVTQHDLKDVLKFPPGCDGELVHLAHRCWSKTPGARPSMEEIEDQLIEISRLVVG